MSYSPIIFAIPLSVVNKIQFVRERIARAAECSGRTGADVQLITVTKYAQIGDGIIEGFIENGLTELGEARPQMLEEKAKHYNNPAIHWHLIGHLQRNKINKVIAHTALIHSLDSIKLAEAIDSTLSHKIHCLIEVAVSDDATKHGFKPHKVAEAVEVIGKLEHIQIDGLMGMSGLDSDERQIRREFASLRELAETMTKGGLPSNVSMKTLSMGMSSDFEIAVEEGSTMVRIGSLLY